MFILDSLMIAGIRWALKTTLAAAEAEMNDDTAVREQLLAAELSRETGEISDEEFRQIEADLLRRIREIRQRRQGGSGPLELGGGQPLATSEDSWFQVEATVLGDFHNREAAPHTTVVETTPPHGTLLQTAGEQAIEVLNINRSDRSGRSNRSNRSRRSNASRTTRKAKTTQTAKKTRTATTTRTARTRRTSPADRTIRTKPRRK